MKIAGTLNDGAWYRANRFIKGMDDADRPGLISAIGNIDTLATYLAALGLIADKTGVTLPDSVTDITTFATNLGTVGIPRQVWKGVLTFDTYSAIAVVGGKTKYKPDHAKQARQFGSDLRKTITNFKFAYREIKDVANTDGPKDGNPGGIADATKGD